MSDPSDVLHRAMRETLAGAPAVAGFVAGRIYDYVPKGSDPPLPYIVFGAFQVLDDGAGCIDGAEVFVTLDVWSRDQRSIEAKRICAAVARTLNDADLDLGAEHRLVEMMHQSSNVFLDADGLTSHGVVTFRVLTEAAI